MGAFVGVLPAEMFQPSTPAPAAGMMLAIAVSFKNCARVNSGGPCTFILAPSGPQRARPFCELFKKQL